MKQTQLEKANTIRKKIESLESMKKGISRFKGIYVYGDGGGNKQIFLSDDMQKDIEDLCDKKISELEKEFEKI
mgnify:CR=1 FL=1